MSSNNQIILIPFLISKITKSILIYYDIFITFYINEFWQYEKENCQRGCISQNLKKNLIYLSSIYIAWYINCYIADYWLHFFFFMENNFHEIHPVIFFVNSLKRKTWFDNCLLFIVLIFDMWFEDVKYFHTWQKTCLFLNNCLWLTQSILGTSHQ